MNRMPFVAVLTLFHALLFAGHCAAEAKPSTEPVTDGRAVVVLLDSSRSASADTAELHGVLDGEKVAAAAAVQSLRPNELFSCIGFNSAPYFIIPLKLAGEAARVAPERLDRVTAFGKTLLFPALVMARETLEKVRAPVKHIILMTDAKVPLTATDLSEYMKGLRGANITLSTIAIGSEGDVVLMRMLAKHGSGRHYRVLDPAQIAAAVLTDLDGIRPRTQDSAAAKRGVVR